MNRCNPRGAYLNPKFDLISQTSQFGVSNGTGKTTGN